MKNNIFLAAIPSYDNRLEITQKLLACEAKRSPLIHINWTHLDDLHITLGYVMDVNPGDLNTLTLSFSSISQFAPLVANAEDVKIYRNAIVLRLEPVHRFSVIHKKMNQKLIDTSENRYHFEAKGHYEPHLTVGRIKNWQALNHPHKEQLINLIKDQFQHFSFLIQQAAIMCNVGENQIPVYQAIHGYKLNG